MKCKMRIIVYLMFILCREVVSGLGGCPQKSFALVDGSACYWLNETKQDYNSGKIICRNNELKLAIIPNERVNKEVTSYINDTLRGTDDNKVWIGVNDLETERVFNNSDGSTVTWFNWYNSTNQIENEPNDLNFPSTPAQDCVCINREGKWFDETCTTEYRALCFTRLMISPSTENPKRKASTSITPSTSITTLLSTSTSITTSTLMISTKQKTTSMLSMSSSYEQSSLSTKIFMTSKQQLTTPHKNDMSSTTITQPTYTSKENTTIMREQADQTESFLMPVIIAASVLFLGVLVIAVICIVRIRRCRKNKTEKYESPLEKKKTTEEKEDKYDILHKDRLNIENTATSNLYDHANMNSELYDEAIQNKKLEYIDEYDSLDKKNEKAISPQNYDIASSSAVIEKDHVYYSSAKFTDDGDNVYVETTEGDYDIINKRRNKQEVATDQIYSHTGADETTYDITVMTPKQNIIDDDTYDSSIRNKTQDDTYDTMTSND